MPYPVRLPGHVGALEQFRTGYPRPDKPVLCQMSYEGVEDRAGSDSVRSSLQPGALRSELEIRFRIPTGVADGIQTHID